MEARTWPVSRPWRWLQQRLTKRSVKFRRGQIIRDFNNLYYYTPADTWQSLQWRGVPCLKCPTDLWSYQEIITATRPEVIVETGVCFGGTSLYLADICRLTGRGEVLGVDIDLSRVPESVKADPAITLLHGSSTSAESVQQIRERCFGRKTMVILDSDHSYSHVREELELYSRFVTPGCYLIVEDTNVAGHPVWPDWPDGGPYRAVQDFMRGHDEFETDEHAARLMLTFNPRGYLRRRPLH